MHARYGHGLNVDEDRGDGWRTGVEVVGVVRLLKLRDANSVQSRYIYLYMHLCICVMDVCHIGSERS